MGEARKTAASGRTKKKVERSAGVGSLDGSPRDVPRSEGESRRERSVSVGPEPGWYKDAIIYELHVRAFADSDGDGIGDFAGLTSRLDYLVDLGVTAIWLLPFYPSPLRDDGYDIADYTGVNPSYGTRKDVRRLIEEAHARGLKVITELVLNHTSDQHAWFKRARKAPAGSAHRAFYVWSDTPDKYTEARIIFQDFETSNWTYDPVARQYFWHRFYSHQPDLNFENPAVHDALMKVVDQWFEAGVDGMRLDAVPYLYEREGTNCENLPETHDFLRTLRAHVDERFPGRMLLAEANQWPEDSIEYFGEAGDECHMAFHFPLMPRLFMSVRMEDRFPVIDILNQTPPIPEGCQWAIFLRNHDELTLEMVTDEERDYMYRSYATDREMRINLGIRRRLAPLLENNRRKIELMNGLLFSLPGTPVLYYGDEIGMGDNVYLGDRDSVRTPMQWSGDRNAGFSRTNPQRLFLPVIIDPEYHYETVNVESQQGNPSSLYWWMKRLIALRKRHRVFGRGDLVFLHPENPKVLAYVRRLGEEHVLVVANLSRFAQPVEMDLSDYEGQAPVEMFGHTSFPPIGELPYFFTLGPHAFHWFLLKRPAVATDGIPVVEAKGEPGEWLVGNAAARWLEQRLVVDLPSRRWFSSKSSAIRDVTIDDVGSLRVDDADQKPGYSAAVFFARVSYADADDEVYAVPVALAEPDRPARLFEEHSPMVMAHVNFDGHRHVLYDATSDDIVWRSLLEMIEGRRTVKTKRGELTGTRVRRGARGLGSGDGLDVHLSRAEQSNSSALFGSTYIMKLFRHVEEGANPDLEIGLHLTDRVQFPHTPAVAGAIEYQRRRGETSTLAMLQRFVPNQGDSWRMGLDAIGRYFERVLTLAHEQIELPQPPGGDLVSRARLIPDRLEATLFDDFLDRARLLGRRTAEMHRALASNVEDEAFEPEPFSKLYQRSLYQSMRNGVLRPMQVLRKSVSRLDGEARELGDELLGRQDELLARLKRIADERMECIRIRCHGDYHLGQVLWTGRDFVIIDFEGEPMRPLGERRLKRSALLDVAGMLRSFQYAAATGLRELVDQGTISDDAPQFATFEGWARYWQQWVEGAFLGSYLEHAEPPLVPGNRDHLGLLLDAWLIQKAAYELSYELNNRPAWVTIPMRGIIELLGGRERT